MNKINFIFLRSDIALADQELDTKRMEFLYEIQKENIVLSSSGSPLFYIESGGSEEKFKKIYKDYQAPYILLATSSNNSLPASLEIMSFLRNNNLEAYLIHGEMDELIKGVKNLSVDKIDSTYNYIDILLYNYIYKCFVVVELKVVPLKAEHVGQITKYINYIDKNIKTVDDNNTIGIILSERNNKIVLEYCSDSRIFFKEFVLV